PPSAFSELIRRLMVNGWKVIVSGGPGDVALARQIAKDSTVEPMVWAGQTSLGELAALYQKARFVISNDSGPSHVAASVGTDVIALFGPTRPEVTAPRGRGNVHAIFKEIGCNKAPCYHLSCPSNVCMQEITVSDVLQVINREVR
ncbi:MAG: glycosyltransferase family 9 protein, partial [Candidatus Omnitrophica bacterium]|nr:glycosyltransferase family 9 protein [Candidatus Omnitrophota bacterium]